MLTFYANIQLLLGSFKPHAVYYVKVILVFYEETSTSYPLFFLPPLPPSIIPMQLNLTPHSSQLFLQTSSPHPITPNPPPPPPPLASASLWAQTWLHLLIFAHGISGCSPGHNEQEVGVVFVQVISQLGVLTFRQG